MASAMSAVVTFHDGLVLQLTLVAAPMTSQDPDAPPDSPREQLRLEKKGNFQALLHPEEWRQQGWLDVAFRKSFAKLWPMKSKNRRGLDKVVEANSSESSKG